MTVKEDPEGCGDWVEVLIFDNLQEISKKKMDILGSKDLWVSRRSG